MFQFFIPFVFAGTIATSTIGVIFPSLLSSQVKVIETYWRDNKGQLLEYRQIYQYQDKGVVYEKSVSTLGKNNYEWK